MRGKQKSWAERSKRIKLADHEKGSAAEKHGTQGMGLLAIRTQAEVAKELGISKQRVQQCEREAIFKLRRDLAPFFEDLRGATSL